MPDPLEELITIPVEIHNGIRPARPSGRLRPVLPGEAAPEATAQEVGGDGVVRSVARHLTRF
jgi:hypothetical protein